METWKAALEINLGMSAKAQKELQDLKKEIQDVNWKRKSKQLQTGDKLNSLNQQWASLVSCNYEIETAIAQLEQQIQIAKSQQTNGKPEEFNIEENSNVHHEEIKNNIDEEME